MDMTLVGGEPQGFQEIEPDIEDARGGPSPAGVQGGNAAGRVRDEYRRTIGDGDG